MKTGAGDIPQPLDSLWLILEALERVSPLLEQGGNAGRRVPLVRRRLLPACPIAPRWCQAGHRQRQDEALNKDSRQYQGDRQPLPGPHPETSSQPHRLICLMDK